MNKPGDHPEFFRFPAPIGTSRESTIKLDRHGQFWHDGERVEHMKLSQALHSWIAQHPDNQRYILTNGYDWTYFEVEEVPFFVVAVRAGERGLALTLSDQSVVEVAVERIFQNQQGELYASIEHKGFESDAKFTQHSQASLGDFLGEDKFGNIGLLAADRLVVPPVRDVRTQAPQRLVEKATGANLAHVPLVSVTTTDTAPSTVSLPAQTTSRGQNHHD